MTVRPLRSTPTVAPASTEAPAARSTPAHVPTTGFQSSTHAAPVALNAGHAGATIPSPEASGLFAPKASTDGLPPEVVALAAKNGFGQLLNTQGAAGTLYCQFQGGLITWSNVTQQLRGVLPNQAAPTVALSSGATGDEVCRLQRALTMLGFLPQGSVDAQFDPRTQAAVSALQKDRGLPVTGSYDAATAKALQGLLTDTTTPTANDLQVGAKGPEVALLQRELTMLGFSTGGVDGDFGPATQAALKSFQTARGITADGVFSAATRTQIGYELPSHQQVPDAVYGWVNSRGLQAAVGSVADELGLGKLLDTSTQNGKTYARFEGGVIVSDPTLSNIDSVTGTGFEDLPGSVAAAAVNYGLGALKGSTAKNGHVEFQFDHGSVSFDTVGGAIEGIQQG